jgi:hypothetical protein
MTRGGGDLRVAIPPALQLSRHNKHYPRILPTLCLTQVNSSQLRNPWKRLTLEEIVSRNGVEGVSLISHCLLHTFQTEYITNYFRKAGI